MSHIAEKVLIYKLYPVNSTLSKCETVPSVSVNFISLVTSSVGLRQEEPQTAFPMSTTWASHIGASVLMGC